MVKNNNNNNSKYNWSHKKILIIDDEPFTHSLLRKVLEDTQVKIDACKDPYQGLELLLNPDHNYDLVIIDFHMPELSGLEVLRQVELAGTRGDMPFVILSASQSTDEKVDIFENKGADFIQKPFHKVELIARLNVHLEIHDLTRELKAKVSELENLAWIDQLTNLSNRRACIKRLKDEMSLKERHDRKLGVLLLDVDHFKRVNDTYGHDVGDQVLCSVAQRISEPLRTTDFAARYGGEEFVVILPEVDLQGAEVAATKILNNLRGHPFVLKGHEDIIIPHTVSIGVAVTTQGDGETPKSLLKRADELLYLAKEQGRDRFLSNDGS